MLLSPAGVEPPCGPSSTDCSRCRPRLPAAGEPLLLLRCCRSCAWRITRSPTSRALASDEPCSHHVTTAVKQSVALCRGWGSSSGPSAHLHVHLLEGLERCCCSSLLLHKLCDELLALLLPSSSSNCFLPHAVCVQTGQQPSGVLMLLKSTA